MSGHKLYLCEKPDQGRIIAKALGGGQKTQGGITGPDWKVTWAFGHLLTPFMPHDYDEKLKKWEWEPLPIVPDKFQFKPKDGMSGKQVTAISGLMKGASQVIISTDADREGELIAYEILNRLKWKGDTKRLWLSDLTVPAVQKALGSLREASETKPLYWAAAARTYADWIVGMNMSRAATLKLAAPGGKPMSVGRVQTPVLAMIVDLERKIENFKPEDYFEISATVSASGGAFKMRHAPSVEKRIKDRATAEALLAKVQNASGPLSVKTEAKKQGPPALLDLNALQQECNSRFSWSADKSLKVMQALYEKHQLLTYPRTDCRVLPEEHKSNVPVISGNLSSVSDLSHLAQHMASPVIRSASYNDAKVTAHHAIVPTNKAPGDLSSLSPDEKKLYLLVSRFWIAAHMPDMEYLQTTITLDANGVPLKTSGRQITAPGWKQAFLTASGQEDAAAEKDETETDADENQSNLPPLKDRETGKVDKALLDAKKTKPPSRFTEKSLLQAMKNIAAHVDDTSAKKTLKDTSGIGTSATRANVIETLKARDYIKVKKRQLLPTDTAYVLIDAMRKTAPSYADPVMTARWEDVLEQIASGPDTGMMKRFVDGIAGSVRKDVVLIKDANIERMAGKPRKDGGKTYTKGRIEGDWKVAIAEGTKITVPFEKKEAAKELGARWNADAKCWVIPKGHDVDPFKKAGFL